MGRLEGKVAIVTGGASGLGLASAKRFTEEGARVALLDLDGAERAAEAIDGALGLTADVTDETALTRAVANVTERLGPPDVLYANAGIPGEGRVHELSLEAWNRVIAVHLTGVFLSAKSVLPTMLDRKTGSIILQSSVAGLAGVRNLPAYAAAKGGVIALARQMAADYAQHGIRTNAICPGTVRTPLVEEVYRQRHGADADAELARRDRDYPAGRLGREADIAGLALFLASDEAAWITGAAYPVDGGATAVSLWAHL
jgi:NAD(P)-dependent dehydrogenase (short-subunit alcohol dehydrogenase family)